MAEHPARFYLCARCRKAVLLCSFCDRGQIYCGQECSKSARKSAQSEAARRYQNSRRGRTAHAARARNWRNRQRQCAAQAAPANSVAQKIVTHQGSQRPGADVSLTACETQTPTTHSQASATGGHAAACCQGCGKPLQTWVRQGFLRPSARSQRLLRAHDFSP